MHEEGPPIWAAFGDLMACLVGLFVLFFSWMILMEVSLAEELHVAEAEAEQATARAEALETALAGPLASGLITLTDGRIGIRGAVLFDTSSAELRPSGVRLLRQLAGPLRSYMSDRGEALMISGFTDDRGLRRGGTFADNWELSSERALTVTRTLIGAGVSANSVFAAGFGPHHPVANNESEEGRTLNRRVEIAPVPRPLFERLTSRETP
ncbi:MAG: OmpA family protein [Myxococcota bacterium]